MSMIRRADSSLCMQKRSTSASTPRKNPRASLYRGYDRDEIRPFTSIVLTPCRRHARSRFGQISVSIMMNSRGFTRRSVRFTNGGRSNGRKNTASVSGQPRPRHLLAAQRRRGQKDAQARIPLAQLRQEGARGQHLAHRDGMDPDRLVAVDVEADRQVAHPLRQVADVFSIPKRLIREPRRQHHREDDDGERVENVHVGES